MTGKKTLTEIMEELWKDYQFAFGSEAGQHVLEDLKKRTHFYTSSFAPGDALQTAFNEGQRCVVLSIVNMMDNKFEDMLKLLEPEKEEDDFNG